MEQGAFFPLYSQSFKGQCQNGEGTGRNPVISAWLFLLLRYDPLVAFMRGSLHSLFSAAPASIAVWASHHRQLKYPQGWDKPGPKVLLIAQLQGSEASAVTTALAHNPFGTKVFYHSISVEIGENCLSHHKVISREPAFPHDNCLSPVFLLGRYFW